MATIQQHREALQDLLVSGVLTSVQVQIISLVYFAKQFGYKPVNGDIRKGFFYSRKQNTGFPSFISLADIQTSYNYRPVLMGLLGDKSCTIVEEISLQYHKRTTREISSQKQYLKFNF